MPATVDQPPRPGRVAADDPDDDPDDGPDAVIVIVVVEVLPAVVVVGRGIVAVRAHRAWGPRRPWRRIGP